MYIVNPLKVSARGLSDLTSTHPPISKRIQILKSLASNPVLADYDEAFRKVTGRAVGLVPFSAIQEDKEPKKVAPTESKVQGPVEKHREVTDLLWRLNGFIFIACACGTNLKVPPVYSGKTITCPHCGATHRVDEADGEKIPAASPA